MKNFYLFLFAICSALTATAQCPPDNTFLMTVTPPCPGTSTIGCINGGQYVTVNVVAGNVYTFTTCGNAAFDTQITVYNGITVIGYNDDDCGLQSTVTWTATFTGTVNVLIDEYFCSNSGACTDLEVTCSLPIQTGNGCNTNTTICTPGLAGPFGFSTPGPAVGSCLDWIGLSYAYIVLYITQSGPLQLLIDGDAATGFLDVSIFDIPPGADPCTAIQDVNNEISCNYASQSGGCNQIGTYFPCGSSVPSPNVTAGDVLMIVVENWSNASTNFTLDLGPPPAAQTGPPDPTVMPAGPFCDTDAPVQLNAVNPGGIWTGPGVSASGVFDPGSVAPGTYAIDYAIGSAPCDAYSQTTITVNDCSSPCLMTFFSTNIGFCQPDNTFAVDGTFSYSNAPASGTLVVVVTTATGTYTQTFNPPFVDGNLYAYNITNAISDGSAATVEVYFTAEPLCTQLINFTAPDACDCSAEIGTFTPDIIGVSTNDYVLCYGDIIDIQTNDDWVAPGEATNPPGPVYDPGVSWLIYSCPPSVGLVPSATEDVANDPCLLGLMSDFDLYDLNDQWVINAFPPGTFTDNIVYYVPITMYSIQESVYSYVNTTIPCYELGTPYAVQYLPQIIASFTQSCTNVTGTISGGLPALDGSLFTAVAGSLTPANASFVNTTASNGGTIAITGLTAGQAFSYQVQDANGCPITISGTFVGPPVLTYPQTAYCKDEPNPSPTMTGVAGGTYSSTAGLSINASSGVINLAASTAGTYVVTYTTPAVPGPACSATFTVTINPLPIIAVPDQTVCANTAVTLSGTGADTYSWTGGITNGVAFVPAGTATYTVTGTITATGCDNTDIATVTVNPLPIVNAGTDQIICVGLSVTLSGSGANTYVWDNGVTNGTAFTPGVGTVTYTVTGTDVNSCVDTDQVDVIVNPLPIVDAGTDQTICVGLPVTLSGSGASTYVWNNGVTNGTAFTPAVGTVTYTVTGTDANGCIDTDQVDVIVNSLPAVNAGTDQSVCDGIAVTLNGAGANSYTWNNGVTDGVAFTQAIGTITYTVTGTDANGCINTDQVDVTVNPNPTPTIVGNDEYCVGSFSTLSTNIPYTTYLWSTGDVTPTTDVTIADNPITVTVMNAFGCSGTSPTFTVTENTVITYNSSITICQGEVAVIHGNNETVAGVYSATFVLPTGCDSVSNVTLNVNPLPTVNAGIDQIVCDGVATTLTGSGATSYVWDNGITNAVAFTQAVGTITYTVTGTDANGCVNTDQVDVTVNSLPVVNAGVDQIVCQNTPITLAGSGANTYVWDNGVTNNVTFTPAVGSVTYTVTGTDVNGCIDTDQVNVTVNLLPVVDAGSDQTVCDGVAVTLFGSGASTYVWNNGVTNNVAFTQAIGTINYTVTGTGANGCVDTDQVDVTVNPLPVVNAGLDQIVCEGATVTLNGSGASSYLWDNGVTNGVAFVPPVGTTTYNVTGTDANGCENTDQVDVIVNPLPVVNAGPDQTVCDGVTVTLSASGANTYTWNNGVSDGAAFNQGVGTMIYTVTGTDMNGCIDTDQVNVTVTPQPIVFAGNDVVICEGEQIILTASGASSYVWNNGVTNGVSFTPSSGIYSVIGTDLNGCVDSDDVLVTVNPLPVPSFIVDAPVCEPFIVTFTNTTPGNSSNCIWTINNGAVLTGCGPIVYTFPNSGTYDVSLTTTSDDGCVGSTTYNDIVNLEDSPNASFNTGSSIITNLDTEVQFNNTSTGASSYVWTFGDETVASTAINPSHIFPSEEPGTYQVMLIAYSALGCVDTAYATITVNEEVIFYVPNTFTPDNDDFNQTFKPIFTSGFDPFDYTLLIFNRWGEIVFESHNVEVGWDATYASKFNVQDGTYTWKIEFKTLATDKRVQVVGHVNVIR